MTKGFKMSEERMRDPMAADRCSVRWKSRKRDGE